MLELFLLGGWAMYPILACSLISWAVILERLGHLVTTRDDRRLAVLAAAAADLGDLDAEGRVQALQRLAAPFLRADDRGLALLSGVAALGPLLGLFGTVVGMIDLFRGLESSGGRPDFAHLAGGIWTALLCTAFGLVAAVPALVAHQVFDRWAQLRAACLEDFARTGGRR